MSGYRYISNDDGTLCLVPNGKANGHARQDALSLLTGQSPHQQARINFTKRRSNLTYDAARSGTDLDSHWQFADALDADSSNSRAVRHKLMHRQRQEQGSNGYYDGIINTHCNMLVGVGPTLRMLTGNRDFNQLVERDFYIWSQAVQLRRKLWAMCHAKTGDGETFAVLINNPGLQVGRRLSNDVQLDLLPIEAEQCQTPFTDPLDTGRIDGIWFDQYNNIVAYDILPVHPGSSKSFVNVNAVTVPASGVLHWFKLKRPGGHRGVPDLTSTLTVGATSRRHREATVAAAETAADLAAIIHTNSGPAGDAEPDPIAPFTSIEMQKRMLMANPMGWSVSQMKGEHPNAEYATFHRLQISELARPLSMPYNAAACDSSTYSFASGKLDTLCYRAALDVERQDCNDLILDPLFAAWFREWTLVTNRRDIVPNHQWDWPTHPVIDAVAESTANDTRLKNGTLTLRQAYSDQGKDFEDELTVMAEDAFGEATEETIAKMRQIVVLKNTPSHAVEHVAQLLGIELPQAQNQRTGVQDGQSA